MAGPLFLARDEGSPFEEAPINTNWATSRQYRGVGEWTRDNLGEADALAIRDMSVADALIEEAGHDMLPGVRPLMALNFLWRRDHAPLPAPAFEFVPTPVEEGWPRCLPGDGRCRVVREGSTEWVGRMWLSVRWIG